jgi:hypothetical protein
VQNSKSDDKTLGSAIPISHFYSVAYKEMDTNFSKPLSNDFNRLGKMGEPSDKTCKYW